MKNALALRAGAAETETHLNGPAAGDGCDVHNHHGDGEACTTQAEWIHSPPTTFLPPPQRPLPKSRLQARTVLGQWRFLKSARCSRHHPVPLFAPRTSALASAANS